MKTILFVIAIFISVWWGFINVGRMLYRQRVEWWSIIIMSIGFTSIITHVIGIW